MLCVTPKFYSCMHKGSFTYFLGNMYKITLLSIQTHGKHRRKISICIHTYTHIIQLTFTGLLNYSVRLYHFSIFFLISKCLFALFQIPGLFFSMYQLPEDLSSLELKKINHTSFSITHDLSKMIYQQDITVSFIVAKMVIVSERSECH